MPPLPDRVADMRTSFENQEVPAFVKQVRRCGQSHRTSAENDGREHGLVGVGSHQGLLYGKVIIVVLYNYRLHHASLVIRKHCGLHQASLSM